MIHEFYDKTKEADSYPIRQLPNKDDLSEILFSTGTTGEEKGIMLSFDNDVALAENVIYGAHLQQDNVEMILSPFNHSHGLRRYYANMYKGAAVVMQSSVINIKEMFDHIESYHVNSMDLVPAALAIVLKLSKDQLANYQNQFRYIQLGSAPIQKEDEDKLRKLLPNTHLYNMYGSTESGISCIYDFNTDKKKNSCIGKASYNSEIMIVNDQFKPIQSNKNNPGLLACKGRMNMLGYWQDEHETQKVLKNGIVYSSDIGYIDEDGDIILLGRSGDIINVGGKKVSPLEIESAALKLDIVEDCGCVPQKDAYKGVVPVLFVQVKKGKVFDSKAIRNALQELLEPYKVPARILSIKKIPRTYKGSMQRHKLKELLESHS